MNISARRVDRPTIIHVVLDPYGLLAIDRLRRFYEGHAWILASTKMTT